MKRTAFIIATHNWYVYHRLEKIFNRIVGEDKYNIDVKSSVNQNHYGDICFKDYWKFRAWVDPETETKLRKEIALSRYPIYGRSSLVGGWD